MGTRKKKIVNSHQKPRSKNRKTALIIVGVLAAISGLIFGTMAIAYFSLAQGFDSKTTSIQTAFPVESLRPTVSPTQSENILLLGTDTRGQIGTSIESAAGGRSDTMMVVHIPADRSSIQVMSIMRDSWVDIPGFGENKVNAAMALGGIPLTVQTVEQIINARIDHVAVIDFDGFKELTNSLGGVEVNNPIGFDSSHMPGQFFAQGPLVLSGAEALAFVRERYAFIDGDYQRVRNQQLFLQAVVNTFISKDVLSNPSKLKSSISQLGKMIAVDPGLNFGYITQKALELRGVTPSAITYFTLPSTGTGMVGDQSVVFVNWSEVDVLRALFATDQLSSYAPPPH